MKIPHPSAHSEPFQAVMLNVQTLESVARDRAFIIQEMSAMMDILSEKLAAVSGYIDVSTINNSKRTSERWGELKQSASYALAVVNSFKEHSK